jgi:hypothetical protein
MGALPSCGPGLAEHSALPAKLAKLFASLAHNLEAHAKALEPSDEAAKVERRAYLNLVAEHRKVAQQLSKTAEAMARYRELPPAKHDAEVMRSREILEAFEDFVKRERDVFAVLERRIEADQKMLVEMVADPAMH